jgi:hypothetical protein
MAGELEQEDYEAGSAREKAQKAKLAAIESERARMAEERASLPIYAHRWAGWGHVCCAIPPHAWGMVTVSFSVGIEAAGEGEVQ